MDIAVSIEKEYSLVRLSGRLDATQAAKLTEALQKALREGPPSLVLDCTDLSYVASMGLRCFLLAQKGTQEAGGNLVFFGLNDNVRSVFSMTAFDKIVLVRANLQDSLASLGEKPCGAFSTP
ncbi:MAG: STAS domain-containing protein [Deltaproteobacteria bacterium]|nr:STAS domain-containing protein [Deltaproteobacteria bacterium]